MMGRYTVDIAASQSEKPTRAANLTFHAKATLLQLRRTMQDVRYAVPRYQPGDSTPDETTTVLAESRSPLWIETHDAEQGLQLGKVQNLRCAARQLDGIVIPAGGLFSFWKQVGRATARRGYAAGRQLREGCLFPAIGGGLCQLSNALYEAALLANCEVVERHPHTRIVPGSAAERDRDATVAWNYLDLRFRPRLPVRLRVFLTADTLIVRFLQASEAAPFTRHSPSFDNAAPGDASVLSDRPSVTGYILIPLTARDTAIGSRTVLLPQEHSCLTCEQTACFRHEMPRLRALRKTSAPLAGGVNDADREAGRVAYLLDMPTPEFHAWIQGQRRERDFVCVPLAAHWKRWGRKVWQTQDEAIVRTATLPVLAHGWRMRRLRGRGVEQRQEQLRYAKHLARSYSQSLPPDVTHVVVSQTLLPFVWQSGVLGGRTFDILLTRLPLHELHSRLEAALARFPERKLLGDFRADPTLVRAERDALDACRQIITPHSELANLFVEKVAPLDWQPLAGAGTAAMKEDNIADPQHSAGRTLVAFAGPTHARKGAYELRDAASALNLNVLLWGGEHEGARFWNGIPTTRADSTTTWLREAMIVVQPSLFEENPRLLRRALERGIPVIATKGCGLASQPGLALVPFGDSEALIAALAKTLSGMPNPRP